MTRGKNYQVLARTVAILAYEIRACQCPLLRPEIIWFQFTFQIQATLHTLRRLNHVVK